MWKRMFIFLISCSNVNWNGSLYFAVERFVQRSKFHWQWNCGCYKFINPLIWILYKLNYYWRWKMKGLETKFFALNFRNETGLNEQQRKREKITTFDSNRKFFRRWRRQIRMREKRTNIIKMKLIVLVLYKKHVKVPTLKYV